MNRSHIVAVLAASALATSIAFAAQQGPESSPTVRDQVEQSVSPRNLGESDVLRIQETLNSEGYVAGPVDGIWGPRTDRAFLDFQEARGLEPSGRLDQETALALGYSVSDFAALEIDDEPQLRASDIRQVQEALNSAGYNAGPVDGMWGPRTEGALRNYQEARGLEPTGRLDQETILALGFSISEFAAGEFSDEQLDR